MNLMLKRVQGESWSLRPRRHNQKDDIYIAEKDLKQVKDNNMNKRFTNRERANTLLVVATLIITVSFAAAFTPPGGYKENIGIPALIQTPAFRLFLLCNGFAFIFSIISALTLILGMNVESLTDITLFIGGFHISIGILWMSVGFLAGSVDVQMLSLMNPKDTKWVWIIIRRLIEIVMAPVVPFVVYL